MRRIVHLVLCVLLLTALTGCTAKPVRQGMQTVDSLTFLCETVTDARAGTVTVRVTVTNGTAAPLYLAAPELQDAAGKTTAAYLDMCVDTAAAGQSAVIAAASDLDALTETGLTRRLYLEARESYTETRTFTCTLPATLTVTVRQAPTYDAEPVVSGVTMALQGEG